MEIPTRGSRPAGLPSIHIEDSHSQSRYRMASRTNSYNSSTSPASIPMSIPNSRDPVPPPLPPPRHLADIASGGNNGPDIAWQWGNSHDGGRGWGGSSSTVAPGSSLHGGNLASRRGSAMDGRTEQSRRQSSNATIKPSTAPESKDVLHTRFDEGYHSLSGTSIGSNRSKYQGSAHDQYRTVQTEAYDKSLLQKLDSRRGSDNKTPPRGYSKSAFSSSASDSSPTTRIALEHRHTTQLKPLSLPIITSRAHSTDSPVARWSDSPISSALSPGNSHPRMSGLGGSDYKSSSDAMDYERSPLSYATTSRGDAVLGISDDTSSATSRSRGSYDARISPDNDDFHMEESGMKRLHIGEYSHRHEPYPQNTTAGQKRRASSPPSDEGHMLHSVGSANDLYRRRESAARASPGPPYHSTSNSLSSIGSAPRSSSYASTLSLSTGSAVSLNSFGRISPGGLSPNTESSDSPYVNSISLNTSPRGSISRQIGHQRVPSDARQIAGTSKPSSALSRVQGPFMCECCPKKPKKFDSQDALNAHEQEKQYECAYCKNRFKNKNEAERHQNSLHLRRHSWSCAALAGYEAVFHVSTTRAESDTCGYCGEDFPRSGISSPSSSSAPMTIPTEQDWEMRIIHLQEMHKFGECNHAKKFFRADHFRQHLKHSHAGTSGKWTNMLENACMKDEPLPEPIRAPERISPGSGRVGIIDEEDEH